MTPSWFARRLLTGLLTVLAVSVLTFFVFSLVPGDPAQVILGLDASDEAIEALRIKMRLDLPVGVRFFFWFGNLLRGDFGDSTGYHRPVIGVLLEAAGPTLSITLLSGALTLLVSFLLGVWAFRKPNSLRDFLVRFFSQTGLVIPSFWLGILLLLFFSQKLGWFPSGSYTPIGESPGKWLRSIFLPSFSLMLVSTAILTRIIRNALLDNSREDFVRTAKSKGVEPAVVLRKHILKNAMVPIVTVFGLQLTSILAGTIIIENIFSIPGLGRLLLTAVGRRDLPLVQGIVLWIGFFTIAINIATDILHAMLDPRVEV
ncbi:MAG TPA: ABC transporter permease [Thermotogota bacterium]|nr:ABC transporter permease [Thermotogota bacterium]HRW91667.1 ABC transporter permease [Thermotogota bacterium]